MAILFNKGQRGFVLKEGFLKPGEQITVDQETAQKLTKAYPNELKEIVVEPIKVVETVQEPVVVKEPEVEETPVAPEEKPTKKGGRRTKKAK